MIVIVVGFCSIRPTDHDHDHDHDQLAEIGTILLLFSCTRVRHRRMDYCFENGMKATNVGVGVGIGIEARISTITIPIPITFIHPGAPTGHNIHR